MRHSFQLMTLLFLLPSLIISSSPFWVSGSVGLSWLGCRRELRKVYKEYEAENQRRMEDEKPGFVQQCSLEDGCSIRFYGDECEHGNGRVFTKKSASSPFYDGYGGDCSFKAQNVKSCVCCESHHSMRIVLQKVLSASVTVEDRLVSKIGKGIMCLVGIRDDDDKACAEVLAKKILVR